MELFSFRAGSAPLLVSMPHTGTFIPEWLAPRLSPAARALPENTRFGAFRPSTMMPFASR